MQYGRHENIMYVKYHVHIANHILDKQEAQFKYSLKNMKETWNVKEQTVFEYIKNRGHANSIRQNQYVKQRSLF